MEYKYSNTNMVESTAEFEEEYDTEDFE